MHYIIAPELDPNLETVAIEGEQARHAVRVRRMEPGEPLILLDGAGTTAEATVDGSDKNGPDGSWRLLVRVSALRKHPRPNPAIHIACPAPKGDLLETMIDQLSQVGAASWRPLSSERSEREPRAGKMDRLARITQESLKQCGRPWLLDLGAPISFSEAISTPGAVLADPQGPPPATVLDSGLSGTTPTSILVLVGPEGGVSPHERSLALDSGLALVGFGPHVLRIGTAAVAAASGLVQALAAQAGGSFQGGPPGERASEGGVSP